MIQIHNKQILVDGKATILMCGEVHYYRLNRDEWQDRIEQVKGAGCNVVASYVPWLCHEPVEGAVDLTGYTKPELDLGAFIDLCQENGLLFFVRPGPFIMAEMKNEGIPHWVYEKHPEVVPVGWDGEPVTTKTLDYLAPAFLAETRKWYRAVMAVIAPRLYTNGGNIVGVQLDNEIGMLSWVSNCPDLTENVITDFSTWLQTQYDAETLQQRYPFDLSDETTRVNQVRSPEEKYAAELFRDLGHFMRNRFARYVATLRTYAEECGVQDVPFVINIHGTGGGRALTYPIGISQLYEAYTQAPGYISGSDIYLGDLTMSNFQDLYLINAFMDSVHNPDQPLTSVEFECGDGNYGSTFGGRYDPSAADFKTRMCIAQGNRMLNYYLFAGGRNYRMERSLQDGNDRIAFTGERHGFAAPVSPEGELNYTYPRMARVIHAVMAVSDKLAVMEEEHDGVAFAFIPDYYMTEARYPGSKRMNEIVRNVEANRAGGAWEIVARAMLLAGYRFGSVDIQNKSFDPASVPVLAVPSARYMDESVQTKLVNYLNAGGGVLLYGEVPLFDMEGNPCSILAQALGVQVTGTRDASENYYLSLVADGWASPRPEVRTHFAQTYDVNPEAAILRVYGTNEVCAFDTSVGLGRAIVFGTAYECDVPLFQSALERLGATPALVHDCRHYGVFMTSTANADGERFLHMLNLDGFDKTLRIAEHGQPLFGGRQFILPSKEGVMLPMGVSIHGIKIKYSTAEIMNVSEDCLEFRLTQPADVIAIQTTREILPSRDYDLSFEGDVLWVIPKKHANVDNYLKVSFT